MFFVAMAALASMIVFLGLSICVQADRLESARNVSLGVLVISFVVWRIMYSVGEKKYGRMKEASGAPNAGHSPLPTSSARLKDNLTRSELLQRLIEDY